MNIVYALIFVVIDKITLVDVLPTKSSCEHFMKQSPGTMCIPVSVQNPKEVIRQLQALETLFKE